MVLQLPKFVVVFLRKPLSSREPLFADLVKVNYMVNMNKGTSRSYVTEIRLEKSKYRRKKNTHIHKLISHIISQFALPVQS